MKTKQITFIITPNMRLYNLYLYQNKIRKDDTSYKYVTNEHDVRGRSNARVIVLNGFDLDRDKERALEVCEMRRYKIEHIHI